MDPIPQGLLDKARENNPSGLLRLGADFTPILGDLLAAKDAYSAFKGGRLKEGAALTGLAALGMVPVVGDAAAKGGAALRRALKSREETQEFSNAWRAENQGRKIERVRFPEVEDAAQRWKNHPSATNQRAFERISDRKYGGEGKWREGRTYMFEGVPNRATEEQLLGALGDKARRFGIQTVDKVVQAGERVGLRLDIPSYERYNIWAVTIHGGAKEKVKAFSSTAHIKNVDDFNVDVKWAADVASGSAKSTKAKIWGEWVDSSPEQVEEMAARIMQNKNVGPRGTTYLDDAGGEWIQVGMNPDRRWNFYDKSNMKPVKSASEVLQIGGLVLAKVN